MSSSVVILTFLSSGGKELEQPICFFLSSRILARGAGLERADMSLKMPIFFKNYTSYYYFYYYYYSIAFYLTCANLYFKMAIVMFSKMYRHTKIISIS